MTKQFIPDLKLKAVNYYHKINNYVKVSQGCIKKITNDEVFKKYSLVVAINNK